MQLIHRSDLFTVAPNVALGMEHQLFAETTNSMSHNWWFRQLVQLSFARLDRVKIGRASNWLEPPVNASTFTSSSNKGSHR
jgi:hypothetical protein